jgi:uncharacterized Rmd1/YagE family protein|tara:strand:+ start:156 stop:998 length:843 start_codon:yes stop_codon:yes gene_type:complete
MMIRAAARSITSTSRRAARGVDAKAAAHRAHCDRLGVSAFYMARSIHLNELFDSGAFGEMPVLIQRNNIVVTLSTPMDIEMRGDGATANAAAADDVFDGDLLRRRPSRRPAAIGDKGADASLQPSADAPVAMAAAPLHPNLASYAVLFNYGAVVFVNADPHVHASVIAAVRGHCEGAVVGDVMRLEDYVAVIDPEMEEWSRLDSGRDSITLRQLDIHNLRIVAGVLGQSVSLQHYETQANSVLEQFRSHNDEIMKLASSGEFFFSLNDMTGLSTNLMICK